MSKKSADKKVDNMAARQVLKKFDAAQSQLECDLFDRVVTFEEDWGVCVTHVTLVHCLSDNGKILDDLNTTYEIAP